MWRRFVHQYHSPFKLERLFASFACSEAGRCLFVLRAIAVQLNFSETQMKSFAFDLS